MELSEKIQSLRKARGLTQEQFAQQLYVSRTAVSKWETGRGIPSMESLQMIAKLCGVTLDDLLCAQEIVTIAENENKENLRRVSSNMDGICNIAALIGLVLPLYKVEQAGVFHSVPLYRFSGWLAVFYWMFPVAMVACGVAQLLTPKSRWKNSIGIAAAVINICAILLLILSGQPYPAVLFFALLVIKGAKMIRPVSPM